MPGSRPLHLGPWPASLLGNQQSQAQLVKLWTEAVRERWPPGPAVVSLCPEAQWGPPESGGSAPSN